MLLDLYILLVVVTIFVVIIVMIIIVGDLLNVVVRSENLLEIIRFEKHKGK